MKPSTNKDLISMASVSGPAEPMLACLGGPERPLPAARTLVEYWFEGRRPAGLPDREHFDPLSLRPWLGYLSVYESTGDGDFINRLEGTVLSVLTGENWQGHLASEVDERFEAHFLQALRRSLESGLPSRRVCIVFQRPYLTAEQILLPVTDHRRGVDQVFVALIPSEGIA